MCCFFMPFTHIYVYKSEHAYLVKDFPSDCCADNKNIEFNKIE